MKKSLMVAALTGLLTLTQAQADEGMWLYNNPPIQEIESRYGVKLDEQWLHHLQRSSVRFNNGGSGSFVSSSGLVLTNHHVASDAIQKLSTEDSDLIKTGFLARNLQAELPTKDLELNVLHEIEDVTAKVKGAVRPGMSAEEAEKARRSKKSQLEKESLDKTGLRSDVVTLFRGGAYHLYRYKKYTDVRLVFAPEIGIAFYGGDSDDFEYPRYCLDMALFRVYENGEPVAPKEYLKWSDKPLKEGDLTFVSGHPGRTERLNTVAHLKYLRDVRYPLALRVVRRVEVLLRTFGERSPERKRRAQDDLFGIQNARKAYLGGLEGLQSPQLLKQKTALEQKTKQLLSRRPDLVAKYGNPYADIERVSKELRRFYQDYYLFEGERAFNTRLFTIARDIHRYREELKLPSGDRLREYRDSNLDSFKQSLLSTAPIYTDLETAKLADSLSFLIEMRGSNDPLVRAVMAGESPGRRASQLVLGSALSDVEVRKQALAEATLEDPLLKLADLVDAESRRLRKRYEEKVSGPLQDAYGRLAQLQYELKTTAGYPDATFSLRLAYGPVSGYQSAGEAIPAFTNFEGLYRKGERFEQVAPYTVPEAWTKARSRLALDTPFNFVHTPDITGGNSGSPVVNTEGELIGLIFDGNIESLVLDFQYEDQVARAVSVDVRAIKQALSYVYDAQFLVDELTAK